MSDSFYNKINSYVAGMLVIIDFLNFPRTQIAPQMAGCRMWNGDQIAPVDGNPRALFRRAFP